MRFPHAERRDDVGEQVLKEQGIKLRKGKNYRLWGVEKNEGAFHQGKLDSRCICIHAHTHTHTHTRNTHTLSHTHAHTHTRARTHTHTSLYYIL
jgi:hypothetical protein